MCVSPPPCFSGLTKSSKNGSELSEMLEVHHVRSQLPLLCTYARIDTAFTQLPMQDCKGPAFGKHSFDVTRWQRNGRCV